MSNSLSQNTRFGVLFPACWAILIVVQAVVLRYYGVSTGVAIYDSSVSNIFLAASALLISLTLRYYNPGINRYLFLPGLVTSLTLIAILAGRTVLVMTIREVDEYRSFFSESFLLRFIFGLLLNGCFALLSVLWYTLQEQQEIVKRNTETEQLAKDAELFRLRQQLQPHFLFNSLNSINALIGTQPSKARTMIQQLSDFLRGTVRKEERQWVSLAEEIEYLRLYLEIEKVRFGHRLNTIIDNNAGEEAKIPALLLQPLVENAIKFGLYDTMGEITIRLAAWQEPAGLKVQVTNPFDSSLAAPVKGTGFGLSSVQRRLFLLFGRNNLLVTSAENEHFVTTITIPQ